MPGVLDFGEPLSAAVRLGAKETGLSAKLEQPYDEG